MKPSYSNGDRVCTHLGPATVIRDERWPTDAVLPRDLVWVKLDAGDNPLMFRPDELMTHG